MNKGLTPLEALEILKEANTIYCGCASNLFARYRFEIETIENALKENEYLRFINRCKDVKELDNAKKLGQLKDIEDKLGFGLNELVQMLINGIWEVGGVDSKTMKPEPSCLLFYYVYGIDFEKKCLKVMRATGYNERSIERSREFVFSSLHLCKYKKKCLGGWALTREELIYEE